MLTDFRHVRALTTLRITQIRNRTRASRQARWKWRLVRSLILLAFVTLLPINVIVGSAMIFSHADTPRAAELLLMAVMIISFFTVLAGCLSVSLQSLFHGREGEFLATLPMSGPVLMIARSGDFARGAAPGTVFGLAVSLGYVFGRAGHTVSGIVATLVIPILSATGAAFAIALTTSVVRAAPPRRTRAALTTLSLATLASAGLVWQAIGRPSLKPPGDGSPHPAHSILEWTPPGWAARAVIHASDGRGITALLYLVLMCGVLAIACVVAARSFDAVYWHAVDRSDLNPVRAMTGRYGVLSNNMLRLAPGSVIHWVRREWMLIGRDFGRISAALWPISAVLLLIGSSLIWDRSAVPRESERFWAMHGPVLLLPWAISLGSTIFAIGSEAHEFGLARSLPTSATAMMIGKYVAYAIPTVFISLMVGLVSLAVSPGNSAESFVMLVLLVWIACATCAVDLAMSAVAPRFGREPVQRSTPFLTRAAAGASGLAMAALVVFGCALSPIGTGSIGSAMRTDSLNLGTGGWVLALAIAILAPITMMVMGTRRASILLAAD